MKEVIFGGQYDHIDRTQFCNELNINCFVQCVDWYFNNKYLNPSVLYNAINHHSKSLRGSNYERAFEFNDNAIATGNPSAWGTWGRMLGLLDDDKLTNTGEEILCQRLSINSFLLLYLAKIGIYIKNEGGETKRESNLLTMICKILTTKYAVAQEFALNDLWKDIKDYFQAGNISGMLDAYEKCILLSKIISLSTHNKYTYSRDNKALIEYIAQNGDTISAPTNFQYIGDYKQGLLQIFDNRTIRFFEKRYADIVSLFVHSKKVKIEVKDSRQVIFYGAPGTGKSHTTNEVAEIYDTIRTTFHPDSDYSTFVGAYKPTMNVENRYYLNGTKTEVMKDTNGKEDLKESKIVYKFVKQAFLKTYIKAWQLFKESCNEEQEITPQFLIIEEINRGNCAQIFGDLFQLLDRKNGFSEYPIEADEDIVKALLDENPDDKLSFGKDGLQLSGEQKAYVDNFFDKQGKPKKNVAEKICKGEVLVLPPNLYIWATMNTSDQSLFPIDSAFKRRWDWKYMKIKDEKKGWKIEVGTKDEEKQDWWEFIQKINKIIANMTSSADKQLGYFFCKANKKENDSDSELTIISTETFVSKVVFYLWNDVFKDYGFEDDRLFKYKKTDENGKETEEELTFPAFYKDDDDNSVNVDVVKQFIKNVMEWKAEDTGKE